MSLQVSVLGRPGGGDQWETEHRSVDSLPAARRMIGAYIEHRGWHEVNAEVVDAHGDVVAFHDPKTGWTP